MTWMRWWPGEPDAAAGAPAGAAAGAGAVMARAVEAEAGVAGAAAAGRGLCWSCYMQHSPPTTVWHCWKGLQHTACITAGQAAQSNTRRIPCNLGPHHNVSSRWRAPAPFLSLLRYVEPLVENVTQLRNHRKYVEGDNTTVNKTIRQRLSQQNAQSGAYCVAIDAARPGTAYIAYGAGGPESSIYREWFNITPKGEWCGVG